jgi:hypothetical protein
MIYKILKLISAANGANYWQFVLNADNTEYSTTDLAVLETKLLELLKEIPISKLKVISEHSISDDLTIV